MDRLVRNYEIIQAIALYLKKREGPVSFVKVKGHSRLIENKGADALAKEGAKGEE